MMMGDIWTLSLDGLFIWCLLSHVGATSGHSGGVCVFVGVVSETSVEEAGVRGSEHGATFIKPRGLKKKTETSGLVPVLTHNRIDSGWANKLKQ